MFTIEFFEIFILFIWIYFALKPLFEKEKDKRIMFVNENNPKIILLLNRIKCILKKKIKL